MKQNARPVMALMYDFDKTLCTRDMQEYTFIPSLGMSAAEFWASTKRLAAESRMDMVLAYMYRMLEEARRCGRPVRRADFVAAGRSIELMPGALDWFCRIRAFGDENGVDIEHYVISSGLKEIIEGSPIESEFRRVYACEFHYDASGNADWPQLVVNYTTKTQFLFRINKGALDVADDVSVNRYLPEAERRIPFAHMMYFGDGMTDVPCMRLVRTYGGQSVAVHGPDSEETCRTLLKERRVNFTAPADYREGSAIDAIVKERIREVSFAARYGGLAAPEGDRDR